MGPGPRGGVPCARAVRVTPLRTARHARVVQVEALLVVAASATFADGRANVAPSAGTAVGACLCPAPRPSCFQAKPEDAISGVVSSVQISPQEALGDLM